jgi:4-hydroxybenzoate polyprenyltransferase
VEGDKNHQIGTLAVKIGQSTAFILGATVVSLGYGFMIWWGYYFGFGLAYVAYHIVALLVFGGLLYRVKLNKTLSLKRFYMSYWILFFMEYFSFFLLYLK